MGCLGPGLAFPVSCLILVWAAGSGKSPPLIHSFIYSFSKLLLPAYLPGSWGIREQKDYFAVRGGSQWAPEWS